MSNAEEKLSDPALNPQTPAEETPVDAPSSTSDPVPGGSESDGGGGFKQRISARTAIAMEGAKRVSAKTAAWSSVHLDPQRHDGLFAVRYMERVVEWIRSVMAATPADIILDRLVHYGNLAALAAMVLALVYGVLGAVRHVILVPIPQAVLFVLLLAAFQYAGVKFLKAGRTLMASTPSRLSSTAFLNTVALLHAVGAVVFLVGGFLMAFQQRNVGVFLIGLLLALVAYGVSFIALYPDRINVSVDSSVGAGEEALGILSFSVKVLVSLVPIVYGVGMIIGMLAMLGACFSRLGRAGFSALGQQGSAVLLAAAAFPFVAYLLFAFYQLGLDVLRAILILPAKLDKR